MFLKLTLWGYGLQSLLKRLPFTVSVFPYYLIWFFLRESIHKQFLAFCHPLSTLYARTILTVWSKYHTGYIL